ncbi:MAG: NUDIX hydrolase [Candidatus Woesearchaeota archaeon]
MAEELVDVVDEEGTPTGERVGREKAQQEGTWHLTVHLWIYTPQGEVIVQKRREDKPIFPGKLDASVGGHLHAGETPTRAGVREAKEELGLDIAEGDLEFVKRRRAVFHPRPGWTNREVNEVFTLRYDGDKKDLKRQEEEIDELIFLSFEDLERRLGESPGSFTHTAEYWQDMLQEMKKRLYR